MGSMTDRLYSLILIVMGYILCPQLLGPEQVVHPGGQNRRKALHKGMGCGRKAFNRSVRRFPVAIPTKLSLAHACIGSCYGYKRRHVYQIQMAANAIFLYNRLAPAFHLYYLGFPTEGKIGRVGHAIGSFYVILSYKIVLWYVAVNACGCLGMTAFGPGCIMRIHHMAVDACFGFV